MKVHAAIAKALADEGVQTMFGIIGDANLFMVDAFVREHDGTYVAAANESGAVLMANGYAITSGKTGVATVTHGPALTNTVTALVEAAKNRTPLVVVAGDTAVVDRENLQNAPQRDMVLPTGAGFEQLRAPSTAAHDVGRAFRRADVERRPIVLNVPVEFQWEEIEDQLTTIMRPEMQAVVPDPVVLDSAVGIIASANRPIVLAGRGTITAEGRSAMLRLANRIGAPVATTLKSKDLFRGEPFDLGIFGTLSNPVAADVIADSDCVIAFGASLNKFTTADGSYLEGKRVVHCDIDRGQVGNLARIDVGVIGDAPTVADTVVQWLDEAEVKPSGFRSDDLARRIADYSPIGFDDCSTDHTVDLRTALLAVEAAVPRDRTLVTDGGRFIFEAWNLLHVEHPSSFVMTVNFGSIGLGMGNAIGAAYGIPERPVLMIAGDGGFMLGGLAEFNTAVRHGRDVIVVVCNDGSYGAEHIQFRTREMDPGASLFDWPDFAPVADALGGRGITVRNAKDLDGLADAIANRDRPLLIDLKLDPDNVPNFGH